MAQRPSSIWAMCGCKTHRDARTLQTRRLLLWRVLQVLRVDGIQREERFTRSGLPHLHRMEHDCKCVRVGIVTCCRGQNPCKCPLLCPSGHGKNRFGLFVSCRCMGGQCTTTNNNCMALRASRRYSKLTDADGSRLRCDSQDRKQRCSHAEDLLNHRSCVRIPARNRARANFQTSLLAESHAGFIK